MKKKLFLTILMLAALICTPAIANAQVISLNPPRVVDEADILTDSEEEDLLWQLDEISERQQFDVVVVTVNSLEGEEIQYYAADYYDSHGYGMGEDYDGVMLLVSMAEREWYILTTGYGIEVLNDSDLMDIEDEIVPYLSDGDFAGAFQRFAECCDEEVTYAEEYGTEETFREQESSPSILISILIGLVGGLIPAFIMRGKLKSVHMQSSAGGYENRGSRQITTRQDIFLYHTVSRTPKVQENRSGGGGSSTFRGSSGRSHGGRGGGF